MSVLVTALGLMLVIEGMLPFVKPALWREVFARMVQMRDGQIRFYGLASVLMGTMLLLLVR